MNLKRSYLLSRLTEIFLKCRDTIVFGFTIFKFHLFAVFTGISGHGTLVLEVEGHV